MWDSLNGSQLNYCQEDFFALAIPILERGDILSFKASGFSMYPFVRSGDVLQVKAVPPSRLRRGDIILCRNGFGKAIVHRMVKKDRKSGIILTKGDVLENSDLAIQVSDVLGKVISIRRGRRRVNLDGTSARITNLFEIRDVKVRIRGVIASGIRAVQTVRLYRRLVKILSFAEIQYGLAVPDESHSIAKLMHLVDPLAKIVPEDNESLKFYDYNICFVARYRKRPIGAVLLRRLSGKDPLRSSWWLFHLYVAWWRRGRGVGEKLCKMVCQKALDDGAKQIKLRVSKKSLPAIRLYLKLGFRQILSLQGGNSLDNNGQIYMTKDLR